MRQLSKQIYSKCITHGYIDTNINWQTAKEFSPGNFKTCIDLIRTNRKYCLKSTSSYETGFSDHHHLIFSIIKTTFASEEPKKFVYCGYKTLFHERKWKMKNDLKQPPNYFARFLNHTSQTNIHMVTPKLH